MPAAGVLAELRREFRLWQTMNAQAERLHLTDTRMQNAWTWHEVTLPRLQTAAGGAGLTYPAWAEGHNPDRQDLNARIRAAAQEQS